MKTWKGKKVTDTEYARLWRLANPEKVKIIDQRYRAKRKGTHQRTTYELPKEKSLALRKAFESGNWRRKENHG